MTKAESQNNPNANCPVCATADVLCSKWTAIVIRDLAHASARFCELERSLKGISPRTLSLRLRELEEHGIVERRTFAEVPPRVEYQLTDKGRDLIPIVDAMRAFGNDWLCGERRKAARHEARTRSAASGSRRSRATAAA
jgi:DNA-binding HxlR family transcriptional regulator